MARPLKGAIRKTDKGTFIAEVPRFRGAKQRVSRTFDTRADARKWLTDQIQRIESGQEADTSPVKRRKPQTSPAPAKAGEFGRPETFADYAKKWWHDRYILNQTAEPGRAKEQWSEMERLVIPYFCGCFEMSKDELRAYTMDWLAALSGTGDDPRFRAITRTYKREMRKRLLWSLRATLTYAGRHGAPVELAGGRSGDEPLTLIDLKVIWRKGDERRRPRLVTLDTVAAVAGRMHVIHQFVLWLLRLAGLRISEAYGLIVANFRDLPDGRGVLLVEAQGGGHFEEWDLDGEVGETVVTTRKERTKTEAGVRQVVLAAPLANLIRLIIRAFHTDPDTGVVDLDARLIPVIRSEVGGPAGFRNALNNATRAINGASDDPDDYVPHDLRKAFSTDLADNPAVSDRDRRRTLGHADGNELDTIYVLADRLPEKLAPAVEAFERELESHGLSDLRIPTTKRPVYSATDEARTRYASAILQEEGWEVRHVDDGWVVVVEAAKILGMHPAPTRRLMSNQVIPATKVDGEWRARLDDVIAHRDRDSDFTTFSDIAAELGMSYHQVYQLGRAIEINPELDAYSRTYRLTEQEADAIRSEAERRRQLRERSMTVAQAAVALRYAQSTVRQLIKRGLLELDAERGPGDVKYVTRDSVDAELGRRKQKKVGISEEEFREYAGMSAGEVRELIRQGVLVRERRKGLTIPSVHAYASGYRPDLLETPMLKVGVARIDEPAPT